MLTRIYSLTGKTELMKINDELFISRELYNAGYRIEADIVGEYSKHVMISEMRSTILDSKFRVWDVDGVKSVVFENGVRYTLDEIRKLDGLSEERVIEAHRVKQMFGGEVVE